jgi:bifunctional DNA-binding transcriptional regulator/antitoxin component of YhaV-PrlF toxin-antitoxin module
MPKLEKYHKVVKMNSKWQITIPKKLRDAYKITTETPLLLYLQGNSLVIRPITQKDMQRIIDTPYSDSL